MQYGGRKKDREKQQELWVAASMYVPALPHGIALAACCVAYVLRRLPAGGYARPIRAAVVLCLLLGYAIGNYISLAMAESHGYARTKEALLRPDESGRSMKQLLDQTLRPGEVIATTNGQAVGYILKHPTTSLVGRPYSLTAWNEATLRAELTRFGVGHVLIFKDARFDPVIEQSEFLGARPRQLSALVEIGRLQSGHLCIRAEDELARKLGHRRLGQASGRCRGGERHARPTATPRPYPQSAVRAVGAPRPLRLRRNKSFSHGEGSAALAHTGFIAFRQA